MRWTTSSSTAVYYHRNQQYSVTALTDSTGSVLERYAYSAYGVPAIADASGTVLTSSALNNRYTYTGREWDNDLQQYHYRARMYDPALGRFCSRDPIGYVSLGLYDYVDLNPIYYLDPSGCIPLRVVVDDETEPKPKYVKIPPGKPKKPHQPTDPLKPMWPLPQANPDDPWKPTPYVAPVTPEAICASLKGFTACANCLPKCESTMQELIDASSNHWSPQFPNNCEDWVYTFPTPKNNNGCYTVAGQSYVYPFTGIPGTEHQLHHVVVVVTLCNGKTLLLDNGWWSWISLGWPMENPNNIFPKFPESKFPLPTR